MFARKMTVYVNFTESNIYTNASQSMMYFQHDDDDKYTDEKDR